MRSIQQLIIILFFLLPASSMAQESFTINGKAGYANAAMAILNYKVGDVAYSDTSKIANGEFNFKGSVPRIVSASIEMRYYAAANFKHIADNLFLYLENKNISVRTSGYLKDGKITGSPINDEYEKLKDYVSQANTTSSIATSNVYAKYAASHTNSFMGLVALSSSMVRDVDESTTQAILDQFTPELKNSSLGARIQETINTFKSTKPGNTAIPFTQNDANGKPVSLSDFKGKYVLIDFWASWCGPCRQENPNLVNTFNQFKNKNFTILGVSLDRTKEHWLKAVKDDRLNWTQVSDLNYFDNAVAKLYAVKGIPTNILIDPDGKIVGKNLFGPQLIQRLNELIK